MNFYFSPFPLFSCAHTHTASSSHTTVLTYLTKTALKQSFREVFHTIQYIIWQTHLNLSSNLCQIFHTLPLSYQPNLRPCLKPARPLIYPLMIATLQCFSLSPPPIFSLFPPTTAFNIFPFSFRYVLFISPIPNYSPFLSLIFYILIFSRLFLPLFFFFLSFYLSLFLDFSLYFPYRYPHFYLISPSTSRFLSSLSLY